MSKCLSFKDLLGSFVTLFLPLDEPEAPCCLAHPLSASRFPLCLMSQISNSALHFIGPP